MKPPVFRHTAHLKFPNLGFKQYAVLSWPCPAQQAHRLLSMLVRVQARRTQTAEKRFCRILNRSSQVRKLAAVVRSRGCLALHAPHAPIQFMYACLYRDYDFLSRRDCLEFKDTCDQIIRIRDIGRQVLLHALAACSVSQCRGTWGVHSLQWCGCSSDVPTPNITRNAALSHANRAFPQVGCVIAPTAQAYSLHVPLPIRLLVRAESGLMSLQRLCGPLKALESH